MAPAPSSAGQPQTMKAMVWLAVGTSAGVPALLGLWIGLVLLGARMGWELTAKELFAWEVGALVGTVLWPVSIAAANRQLWHSRANEPGSPTGWGRAPTTPVPRPRLTAAQRLGRVTIMAVGATSLTTICALPRVSMTLLGVLYAAGSSGRSRGLALQVAAFVLMAALMLPTLALTERALRRHPAGDPARFRLEVSQNWYLAAVLAWVMCAVIGILAAQMVLHYL